MFGTLLSDVWDRGEPQPKNAAPIPTAADMYSRPISKEHFTQQLSTTQQQRAQVQAGAASTSSDEEIESLKSAVSLLQNQVKTCNSQLVNERYTHKQEIDTIRSERKNERVWNIVQIILLIIIVIILLRLNRRFDQISAPFGNL